MPASCPSRSAVRLALAALLLGGTGCDRDGSAAGGPLELNWYVFHEPSGAFAEAARLCSLAADGAYHIRLRPLPVDADQQHEQLARRLAARDPAIDLIGMDVIWTAEFARAGWILPWSGQAAAEARAGRFPAAVASATYDGALWAIPFTSNAQLLWYRSDRIPVPPDTWDDLLDQAEALGPDGRIELQGERYEGLTVFFNSLLASAGGRILDAEGRLALETEPTLTTLRLMRRLGRSPGVNPALSTEREDQSRLAFEAGQAAFMVNYSFVWPSAQINAPAVAAHMAWAAWPSVLPGRPARVTLGGIQIGVSAYSANPEPAFRAAACLASADHQRLAARAGGLPPSMTALYDEPGIRAVLPFADQLRDTLRQAALRPANPRYGDLSLAIGRVLHPLRHIEPKRDLPRLRRAVQRALGAEGLL